MGPDHGRPGALTLPQSLRRVPLCSEVDDDPVVRVREIAEGRGKLCSGGHVEIALDAQDRAAAGR